jgi:hypothetical protein
MAKKARRRLEEDEEFHSFQFPRFDDEQFLAHEFEQTYATAIAFALAGGMAVVSYLIDRANLPAVLALAAAIAILVASPFLIQRLRPLSSEYTKGDWAGLIVMMIFGWLGLWFVLLNVLPT